MIHDSTPYKFVAVDVADNQPSDPTEYESGYSMGRGDERDRVLGLFDLVLSRLVKSKGRGWLTELERLRGELEAGHQQIPFAAEPDTTDKGMMYYRMYEERFGAKREGE